MTTRATKPKHEDDLLSGWESMPERVPSVMKADTPVVTRTLAMVSLLLTALGTIALVASARGWPYLIGPGWGFAALVVGIAGLLYHAFRDREAQFRRIYGAVALFLVIVAVALRILPIGGGLGALFLPYGVPSLGVAWVLLLAVIRNEEDQAWRNLLLLVLAAAGALQMAGGIIGGTISQNYLLGEGLVLMLLGLLYIAGFIGMQSLDSPIGYRTGQIVGMVGAGILLIAVVRSALPQLLYRFGFRELPPTEDYFVPAGVTFMSIGLLYWLVSAGIRSENQFVVLTRRELAAFFYSPIAYLVIFGWMLISWYAYWQWVNDLLFMMQRGAMLQGGAGGIPEPIVRSAFFSLVPVIGHMFVVPILTMRLLSEERRSGTLEVLLTAPVREHTVVLSKFVACLVFYLVSWIPWFICLAAFRIIGGEAFDYKPLMSFFLTLVCTGTGLVAIGVFCSSVTRNQIIAAVFTFGAMILYLAALFGYHRLPQGTVWSEVLHHLSIYDLWDDSLSGYVTPRYLFVHLSIAGFFLFLTVRLLDARKWS